MKLLMSMEKWRSHLLPTTDLLLWDVKDPTSPLEKKGVVEPGEVANLYGLWDWVGMVPLAWDLNPIRANSHWAGLCPEKLVNK